MIAISVKNYEDMKSRLVPLSSNMERAEPLSLDEGWGASSLRLVDGTQPDGIASASWFDRMVRILDGVWMVMPFSYKDMLRWWNSSGSATNPKPGPYADVSRPEDWTEDRAATALRDGVLAVEDGELVLNVRVSGAVTRKVTREDLETALSDDPDAAEESEFPSKVGLVKAVKEFWAGNLAAPKRPRL